MVASVLASLLRRRRPAEEAGAGGKEFTLESLEPRLLLSATTETSLVCEELLTPDLSEPSIPAAIEPTRPVAGEASELQDVLFSLTVEDVDRAPESGEDCATQTVQDLAPDSVVTLNLLELTGDTLASDPSLSGAPQSRPGLPPDVAVCEGLGTAGVLAQGEDLGSQASCCFDASDLPSATEELVTALHAANPPPQGSATLFADTADGTADLGPVLQEAIRQWSSLPMAEELQTRLAQVRIQVADFPGATLAQALGEAIVLDTSAAGHGWFIDPTPSDNEEFTLGADGNRWFADSASAACGQVDLLTVLLHEIGHVLGLGHDSGIAVMGETLASGRRVLLGNDPLPLTADADPVQAALTASAGALAGQADDGGLTFRILDSNGNDTPDVQVTGSTGEDGAYTDITSIAGISGGYDNILVDLDLDADWVLTGTGSGSLTIQGFQLLSFSQIENLVGGEGEDTLVGPDVASTWLLTDANSGSVSGVAFIAIENVAGGSDADDFDISDDASLSGVLDGGTGTDTLRYSDWADPVLVNLAMGIATETGRITSIENATGGSGDDILIGDDSANVLTGGSGNDILVGEAGNDILVGEAGNDTYLLTPGDTDTITEVAGGGNDTLDYSAYLADSPVTVDLAAGTATGTAAGLAYIENVIGGSGDDILTGDLNANELTGGSGNDTLAGGSGNDILAGGPGDDTYVLAPGGGTDTVVELEGEGSDTLDYSAYLADSPVTVDLVAGTATGTAGLAYIENVIGGSANDTLTGNDSANRLDGGPGSDTLTGGAGDDTCVLNPDGLNDTVNEGWNSGNDTLDYSAFTDPVTVDLSTTAAPWTNGIANIENVTGGSGDDILSGTEYANRLSGGPGDDTLTGGAGDDTYVLNPAGTDTIIETGGGSDTLDYSSFTAGVEVNLSTEAAPGTAPASNISNIENVTGGSGNDTLTGDGNANVLNGGPGDDTMAGGAGNDSYVLTPDGGADTLTEADGGGTDTIYGPDVDTDWIITAADYDLDGDGILDDLLLGPDSGLITGGTSFVGIENLVGGSADDNFKFEAGGSISGSIQGGGQVEGDAIIAAAEANAWNITGANAGSLNGNTFSGIENLIGGSLDDTFEFGASGSISGLVEGGPDNDELETPPVDTMDCSALAGPLTVDLEEGTVTAGTTSLVGSHDAIDVFIGSTGSDTVVGYDLPELFWTITGPDEFTVAAITFQGFENLTGQADNIDGFLIEAAGSISGLIDGGTGGTDGLFITILGLQALDQCERRRQLRHR